MIRLRRLDNDRKYGVGDTVCEILLKNANDGTSTYDLMAGLFRVCCLNWPRSAVVLNLAKKRND
ncbi:DUF932 domain-containing protein [uncultured Roseibium sp.]|uniref:DUF932 domain-containing protein n=1 Tax=uncultured Roseibium sp. TaxID=1936171 RepID=UPI003412D87B